MMEMPLYEDKEVMQRNTLTAIELCGEIDRDGDALQEYGDEADFDADEDYNANENEIWSD